MNIKDSLLKVTFKYYGETQRGDSSLNLLSPLKKQTEKLYYAEWNASVYY